MRSLLCIGHGVRRQKHPEHAPILRKLGGKVNLAANGDQNAISNRHGHFDIRLLALSFSHHMGILSGTTSLDERFFYIRVHKGHTICRKGHNV